MFRVRALQRWLRLRPGMKIKDTLYLPSTSFPARGKPATTEPQVRDALFNRLYKHASEREGPLFTLHDGPPYANGDLHMGHFLNKTIKDMINRYKILKGFRVQYRPGWDCHGLPIELKALEHVKDNGAGPLEVRSFAQAWASHHVASQRDQFKEWGILGDWEHPYTTYSPEYEAKELQVFKTLFEKGLVHRALKPVYWSPSSKTALAEAELEYVDDHESTSAFVFYPVQDEFKKELLKGHGSGDARLSVMIWTTTPWTLPASTAVSYSPDIQYCLCKHEQHGFFIMALSRTPEIEAGDMEVVHLYRKDDNVFKGVVANHPWMDRSIPLVQGGHVLEDSGTGLVHTAPAYGLEDFDMAKEHGIKVCSVVNDDGTFNEEAGTLLSGKHIFSEGSKHVLELLDQHKALFRASPFKHRYPYDWRTKQPVIQRATKQWFLSLGPIQNRAMEAVDQLSMIPQVGYQRLRSTIGTRSEWCLSRQRSWGVPIPVFYHKDTGEPLMSAETIEYVCRIVESEGTDAWWMWSVEELLPEQYRDEAFLYRKGTDTMDVWFDSGVSWMAAMDGHVSNLIVEGSDQHRGWFQSSLLTCIAARGAAPTQAILTHGFVLDGQNRKMSKSIGNVIHPDELIRGTQVLPGTGVDQLRQWVASSDVTQDVSISPEIVQKVQVSFKKIRNTMRFLAGSLLPHHPIHDMSRFPLEELALSRVQVYLTEVEEHYEQHDLLRVMKTTEHFLFSFVSGFYVSSRKDALYTLGPDSELRCAISFVLRHLLEAITKSLAPILPHMTEELFHSLDEEIKAAMGYTKGSLDSILLTGWPKQCSKAQIDQEAWDEVMDIRSRVNQLCEDLRSRKVIHGNNLGVKVELFPSENSTVETLHLLRRLAKASQLPDLFVCSSAVLHDTPSSSSKGAFILSNEGPVQIQISRSPNSKCMRCWKMVSGTELVSVDERDVPLCTPCITYLRKNSSLTD